ncbi:pyridoxamine 5'-phosphate oxidase family protein [Hoyosella subflava]|uniref:Pyridoxamine 5'-phosphate oxidase, FMN-binding protein n=1 Tax=Hoyosella subflava (strain DSM 45089 / JCM 17490 / NBRC 109087 / DQS3-9A1) TaxID=443218 RepID=F6ERB1_HOYSD|nr:pyridoxamine 5'-phosphate oxidase family protein [Hoyosella subflava]AEF41989.1 Pyridoxamine 5'-phosphate oxidase, FMN-binding protein [Hoyosella subflava DQS3-9A1]
MPASSPQHSSTGPTPYRAVTDGVRLRALLGDVAARASTKERHTLHARDREWLALSPFCIIATSDMHGNCDASPKGDPPGFVHVIDNSTIAVPERPGNRRGDGYHNILENPHAGIISLIPGRNETLRINGRAHLVEDAPFFDQLVVKGHRPILAIVVEIDTIFFHCAKAFMRSSLWKPSSWKPDTLPPIAQLTKEVQPQAGSLESLEKYYSPENYTRKLYSDE